MDSRTQGTTNAVGSQESALSAELIRILEAARKQLEEEIHRQLRSAVEAAGAQAMQVARGEREQAVSEARGRLAAELQAKFDQTLQQHKARVQGEFDQKIAAAARQWEKEKAELEAQVNLWKTYATVQSEMAASRTQAEILARFLDRAEAFAPNLAVYVAKADGLALWQTRGRMAFPQVISQDTIDPEAYFKPIVIREKLVAAVCARQPLKSDSMDFLSAALSRAVEAFGMRLQNRAVTAVS